MKLERLAAVIRPRTPWEGLDLGFALARRWFPQLWLLWWLTALPAGALAAFWLPNRPDLWVLAVWWLKPVYEAPLLLRLSRALFSEPLPLGSLWRQRGRVLPLKLMPYLLWRRLALARSFELPLVLLEGLGGRARGPRRRVLRGTDGSPAWLTVICLHLESVLWLSALLLIAFLVPDELPRPDLIAALLDIESGNYWASALLYWLAMSIMAPFYVAAGFASYLTRRTEIEAWDLEIELRGAAAEQERRGRVPRASVLVVLLALLGSAPWEPVDAAAPEPTQARELIAEVLAGEDFGTRQEVRTWVYLGDEEDGKTGGEPPGWLRELIRFLADGATLGAGVLKWTLILLASAAVIMALRRILQDLGRGTPAPGGVEPPVDMLSARFTAAPLPADVPTEAGRLAARGDPRGALSLLYRAGLSRLSSRHGLAIPAGATEGECLALAERSCPPEDAALLRRLTRAWARLAYGGAEPMPEEIAALLRDWRSSLERPHGD